MSESQINSSVLYKTDPKSPGDLFEEISVVDESIFGSTTRQIQVKLSPIYTDYTHIVALFSCYENRQSFIENANRAFAIYVRQRTFDSLSQFGAALQALTKYGVDVNDVRFMHNGPNCKN